MDHPLPPYTHIPGVTPHPIRDPAGHSYQPPCSLAEILESSRNESAVTLESLAREPEFSWGATLFNAGYYWEAHEAWESLWHRAGRTGPTADLLKGLIKLAAAGVKLREHNADGVERHARRACDLLASVENEILNSHCQTLTSAWPRLIALAERLVHQPPPFPEDQTGKPVAALPRLPHIMAQTVTP